MPDKEFIEDFPLYRKLEGSWDYWPEVKPPPINVYCPDCGSDQTFCIYDDYRKGTLNLLSSPPRDTPKDKIVILAYYCASCRNVRRFFFLRFASDGSFVEKVGQYPPWEIKPDTQLAKALGTNVDLFKKGLACESHSYGIAAFAYYRRIVELQIDGLLNEIPNLMDPTERETYMPALEKAEATTVTEDKIALVKELLPPILRPDGMNPLALLHQALSEGLHEQSDERCIELAEQIREVMVFLVQGIANSKRASKRFTENMRKLLDRKK